MPDYTDPIYAEQLLIEQLFAQDRNDDDMDSTLVPVPLNPPSLDRSGAIAISVPINEVGEV